MPIPPEPWLPPKPRPKPKPNPKPRTGVHWGRRLLAALAAILTTAALTITLTAATARADIYRPCNYMQRDSYLWVGIKLYKCVYVWGLGGWYWVYVGTRGGG